MIETKITLRGKNSVGVNEFDVELSLNMQMWLGLYIEPDKDKPETWEDEHRVYVFDETELEHLSEKALEKSKELQQQVFTNMGYEASELSYKQLAVMQGGKPNDGITDKPYRADEDLVFLYGSLQVLADFMYEVGCNIE
jgi:hypothetical protein